MNLIFINGSSIQEILIQQIFIVSGTVLHIKYSTLPKFSEQNLWIDEVLYSMAAPVDPSCHFTGQNC